MSAPRVLPTFLLLAALAGCTARPTPRQTTPAPPVVDFTVGKWVLYDARDEGGSDWSGSTLTVHSQEGVPDGLTLAGKIVWHRDGRPVGTEHVIGMYRRATGEVRLEGQSLEDAQGLFLGSYQAVLSEDGRHLRSGTWTDAGGKGTWQAKRE